MRTTERCSAATRCVCATGFVWCRLTVHSQLRTLPAHARGASSDICGARKSENDTETSMRSGSRRRLPAVDRKSHLGTRRNGSRIARRHVERNHLDLGRLAAAAVIGRAAATADVRRAAVDADIAHRRPEPRSFLDLARKAAAADADAAGGDRRPISAAVRYLPLAAVLKRKGTAHRMSRPICSCSNEFQFSVRPSSKATRVSAR